jgi:hypothetical protein
MFSFFSDQILSWLLLHADDPADGQPEYLRADMVPSKVQEEDPNLSA